MTSTARRGEGSRVAPPARAAATVVAVAAATVALLPLRAWVDDAAPVWTGSRVVDAGLAYQACALAMTAGVIGLVRALGARARLLRRGDVDAPAARLRALGVAEGEPWRAVLRNFAVIATIATAVVVFLQVARDVPGIAPWLALALALALPFAAVNAAVEEGLLRVALLEGAADVLGRERAALLSGALFGAVHYLGVPGGLPGVAMAGFLGFVLARSVVETGGVFGAWLVHFLQDVVIFTLLFAVAWGAG
jgi:hypothetical protein